MKKLFTFLMLGSFVFLLSCKDDEEPEPPHEVGEWELDSYMFINFPAGFESNENLAFGISELSFGGVSYEDYYLKLKNDGSFELKIGIPGPDVKLTGTWELDDDELQLDSDDGDQEWRVEKNEENDLWLSVETQSDFIPDIYYDTVSQSYNDYLNTLSEEQLDSVANVLFKVVTFDLVYVFERE